MKIKNPLTTITGLVMLLLSALNLFGVITTQQHAALTDYATTIIQAAAGIIALFAADPGGEKAGL